MIGAALVTGHRDEIHAVDFPSPCRPYSDHQETPAYYRRDTAGCLVGRRWFFGRDGGVAQSSLSQSAGVLWTDRGPFCVDQGLVPRGCPGQFSRYLLPILEIRGASAAPQGAALGHPAFLARRPLVLARACFL